MLVAVTGASGLIGTALVRRLTAEGHFQRSSKQALRRLFFISPLIYLTQIFLHEIKSLQT